MTGRAKGKEQKLSPVVGLDRHCEARTRGTVQIDKFVQLTNEMFNVIDFDGNLVLGNQVFFQTIGYSPDELANKTAYEIITSTVHPEDIEPTLSLLQELSLGGEIRGFQNRYRCSGGEFRWYSWNGVASVEDRLIYLMARDITEGIKAKTQAETLNKKFTNILDSMTDAFYTVDNNWCFTYFNKVAEKMFNKKQADLIGKNLWTEFPGLVGTVYHEKFLRAKEANKPVAFEGQAVSSGIWLECQVCPIENGLSVFYKNISKRKKAERKLLQSERLFFKAFHANPHCMAIATFPAGRFIDMNEAFTQVLGYTKEDLLGRTADEICLWQDSEERKNLMNEVKKAKSVQNWEVTLVTKNGRNLLGLFSMETMQIDGTKCSLGCFTDLTEKKSIEQELAHLDRLNLIGQMAASIGHEIRNPMTTVRGFLQLLGEIERNQPDREYYDIMIDELDRANSIITEFLALSKNKLTTFEDKSVNDILDTIYPLMLVDALKSDKTVQLRKGQLPNIPLDGKEIRQLVLNLVRNGLEAMPAGGKLLISTYLEHNNVVVAVKDEGGGISPDILEKLGTPFLTTKNQGTGLGLAVCYSIANRHNAKIEVETGPSGTTFYVRFAVPNIQAELLC